MDVYTIEEGHGNEETGTDNVDEYDVMAPLMCSDVVSTSSGTKALSAPVTVPNYAASGHIQLRTLPGSSTGNTIASLSSYPVLGSLSTPGELTKAPVNVWQKIRVKKDPPQAVKTSSQAGKVVKTAPKRGNSVPIDPEVLRTKTFIENAGQAIMKQMQLVNLQPGRYKVKLRPKPGQASSVLAGMATRSAAGAATAVPPVPPPQNQRQIHSVGRISGPSVHPAAPSTDVSASSSQRLVEMKFRRCIVIGCGYSDELRYAQCPHGVLQKDCTLCPPGRDLFCIPRVKPDRLTWLQAINRRPSLSSDCKWGSQYYEPGPMDRVCSNHFVQDMPTEFFPTPVLNLGYGPTLASVHDLLVDPLLEPPNAAILRRALEKIESDGIHEEKIPSSLIRPNIHKKEKAETDVKTETEIVVVSDSESESNDVESKEEKKPSRSVVPELVADGQLKVVNDRTCENCNRVYVSFNALLRHSGNCFKCEYCLRVFMNYEDLLTHSDTHRGDLKCSECGVTFRYFDSFFEHFNEKHSEKKKPTRCPKCLVTFPSSEALYKHSFKYEIRRNDCCVCGIRGLSPRQLELHLVNVHKEVTDCPLCSESMAASEIRQHLDEHRQESSVDGKDSRLRQDDAWKVCKNCRTVLSGQAVLRVHMKNCWKCEDCSKIFKTQLGLELHRAVHTLKCPDCGFIFRDFRLFFQHCEEAGCNQNPRKCPKCEQVFTDQESLDKHSFKYEIRLKDCVMCNVTGLSATDFEIHVQEVHDDVAQCPICGLSKTGKEIRRHMHNHCVDSLLTCSTCHKSFRTPKGCMAHVRNEHGRPLPKDTLSCRYCNKSFGYRADLIRHERRHTGEEPYRCGACGERFHNRLDYDSHVGIHRRIKRFKCPMCAKAFALRKNMQNHMKLHASKGGEKNLEHETSEPDCRQDEPMDSRDVLNALETQS